MISFSDSKGGGATVTAASSVITVSINGTVTREQDVFLKCTFEIVARSIFWERNGKMVALKIKDVEGVDVSNEKFIGIIVCYSLIARFLEVVTELHIIAKCIK